MSETKGDIVKRLKLEETGSVDYALPQDWVDDVKLVTTVFPVHHFVWYYPNEGKGKIFGYPYPLTAEGVKLLRQYNARRGTKYPIPKIGEVVVKITATVY